MTEHRTFLALPSYEGKHRTRAAQTIYTESTVMPMMQCAISSSLLTQTFNALWCEALNRRHEGITHFAMLHDDIEPEGMWVDVLIEEMQRVGADIISAVVPLKNSMGLTSTAVESSDPWKPRRLTMTELAALPETITAESVEWVDLRSEIHPISFLINTGCFVCRFTEPWVDEHVFHIEDAIRANSETGKREACVFPEDWNFSRWANRRGLKIASTRKVRLTHIGIAPFPNYGVWGEPTDPLWAKPKEECQSQSKLT